MREIANDFSGRQYRTVRATGFYRTKYTYDANGRMITRGSGEIDWYSFDLPSKIDDLSDSSYTEFWYGPDRARIKQYQSATGATIRYAGTLFEFEDAATDTYRHYVQAGDQVIAVVERVSTTNTRQYLHRDHQGSVVKVTDAAGSLLQSLAFDAWGLRRNASDWSALGSPFAGSHETERGYTGHEHLDTVGLIHMNGRVQDPILGRFISADPLIQAPYRTQSHNRYSYVWNNPASLTDPSGFCSTGLVGNPVAHLYCDGTAWDQIQNAEAALFELRKQWGEGGAFNLDARFDAMAGLGELYHQWGLELRAANAQGGSFNDFSATDQAGPGGANSWTFEEVLELLGQGEAGRQFIDQMRRDPVNLMTFTLAYDRFINPDGSTEIKRLSNILMGNYERETNTIRLHRSMTTFQAATTLYHEYQHRFGYGEVDARVRTEQLAIDMGWDETFSGYRTSGGQVDRDFISSDVSRIPGYNETRPRLPRLYLDERQEPWIFE